jgi:hypothetical protein
MSTEMPDKLNFKVESLEDFFQLKFMNNSFFHILIRVYKLNILFIARRLPALQSIGVYAQIIRINFFRNLDLGSQETNYS